jgi:hypothetical protein
MLESCYLTTQNIFCYRHLETMPVIDLVSNFHCDDYATALGHISYRCRSHVLGIKTYRSKSRSWYIKMVIVLMINAWNWQFSFSKLDWVLSIDFRVRIVLDVILLLFIDNNVWNRPICYTIVLKYYSTVLRTVVKVSLVTGVYCTEYGVQYKTSFSTVSTTS